MSQITRCPTCQTVFRVVQDQLRMSDGWVRCGQCTDVFDARATLAASATEMSSIELAMQVQARPEELVQPPVFLAPAEEPQPKVFPSDRFVNGAPDQSHTPDETPPLDAAAILRTGQEPIEPVLLPDALPSVAQSNTPVVNAADAGIIPSPLAGFPGLANEEPGISPAAVSSVAPEATVSPPSADNAQPALADVSFMRAMPNARPPPSGVRRFVLGLVALVLSVVLVVQIAVLERDRLAAMFPQIRPALIGMCEQLGCSVAALRQIESVVIDSSSFNRFKGDTYRLNLVLRNTASIDVAIPSVELTLTDSQDQALLRRVLSANELGKSGEPQGVLAAGAEWQGQATITVRMAPNAERFTGYRVLAFYP